ANQVLISGWSRVCFDATTDLCEIRVHEIRNDDADEVRMIRGERPRKLVWAILHLLRGGENARARRSADLRMIIDRTRHRHLRDVECAGDVFESNRHEVSYRRCFRLAVIAASARGFITAYPCGFGSRPSLLSSSLRNPLSSAIAE